MYQEQKQKVSMLSMKVFLLESYSDLPFTLYIDMDGVLVDWEKAFQRLGYGPSSNFDDDQTRFYKMMNKQKEDFWINMDFMPDGHELWNYSKQFKPIILSSPFRTNACITGKMKWVENNLKPKPKVILESKKYKYATPNSILIDDKDTKIDPWNEHGGIGIKHINAKTTIQRLNHILKKNKWI